MKTTNEDIWKFLISESSHVVPTWVNQIGSADVDVSELIRSQKLDIEVKELDASYLSFLEQQIALDARGIEWTGILRRRLEALRPFVGKKLATVVIMGEAHRAVIKIDPENDAVVSVEDY